jgi:arsenate reductase
MESHYNVLFLCTSNSARSIFAEAILDHKGHANFPAYSAGSFPRGAVHPMVLKELEQSGLSSEGLRQTGLRRSKARFSGTKLSSNSNE